MDNFAINNENDINILGLIINFDIYSDIFIKKQWFKFISLKIKMLYKWNMKSDKLFYFDMLEVYINKF